MRSSSSPVTRSCFLPSIALFAALVIFFLASGANLAARWNADPNYSHGFLVLPISLLLAWFALKDSPYPEKGELNLGILNVVAGIVFHWAAIVFDWPLLDFPALALCLRGLALAAGGKEWAAKVRFPILFLFFMFPLPTAWTAWVSLQAQEMVAAGAASILDVLFVCHRQGTTLNIAGVREKLVVAEECSGLRQMIAFLALAALLGYLSNRKPVHRILLLILAIPVAVLANLVRVLLMGIGARLFGGGWIDSWLHDAPMLFSLPFGIALFFLLDRLLAGSSAKKLVESDPLTPAPLPQTGAEGNEAATFAECGVAGDAALPGEGAAAVSTASQTAANVS